MTETPSLLSLWKSLQKWSNFHQNHSLYIFGVFSLRGWLGKTLEKFGRNHIKSNQNNWTWFYSHSSGRIEGAKREKWLRLPLNNSKANWMKSFWKFRSVCWKAILWKDNNCGAVEGSVRQLWLFRNFQFPGENETFKLQKKLKNLSELSIQPCKFGLHNRISTCVHISQCCCFQNQLMYRFQRRRFTRNKRSSN